MQTIVMYQAADGQRFTNEADCRQYERTMAACRNAMCPLGPRPELNSGDWHQHTQYACFEARRLMVELGRTMFPPKDNPIFDLDADKIHPSSMAGRLMTDTSFWCVNEAWGRLMCINFDDFREYNHPFFAINPTEANGFQVN